MNSLIAVLIGLVGGLGLLMLIQGIRGNQVLPNASDFDTEHDVSPAEMFAWFVGGCIAAIGVFLVTGWFVLAVTVLGVVTWMPRMLNQRGTDDLERTKAIAEWTEMIRDNMASAAGLEQALVASATYAPDPIHQEVTLFARSLDHTTLENALTRLGDDLNHPSADMVIVSLTNAARMQATDLAPLLTRLSATTREDVRLHQRVSIESNKTKLSARIVVGITLGVALMLWAFNPQLVEVYDTFEGQIMMTVILAVFGVGIWSIRRLSKPQDIDRFTARKKVVV